jgi:hypothetical protein
MWIRILLFNLMRIRILPFALMRVRILLFYFDADANPELTNHFFPESDPLMLQNDPLRLPTFHFDADPDPAFPFDADPDPQHWNGNHKGRGIVYGRICLHAENNVTH